MELNLSELPYSDLFSSIMTLSVQQTVLHLSIFKRSNHSQNQLFNVFTIACKSDYSL